MPTLDWLNRAEALTTAGKVPYRILQPVAERSFPRPQAGAPKAGNPLSGKPGAELTQGLGERAAHDKAIAEIINAIRQLMAPEEPKKKTSEGSIGGNLPSGYVGAKKRPIGFAPWKEE